jgi:hypothetical protein
MSLILKITLMKLEEERKAAWFERNKEALSELLADDYCEVNFYGRLNKDEVIQDLFPHLELLTFDMSYFKLLSAGEDTAILTYQCRGTFNYKGKELSGDFHVSAVYEKLDEDWKLLLWQITPII